MIKPTVGRIVWVWLGSSQKAPIAAIVTAVGSDTDIQVCIFAGVSVIYKAIDLYQGEGPKPAFPYAEWMPYQTGQAKKTEELEAKLTKETEK